MRNFKILSLRSLEAYTVLEILIKLKNCEEISSAITTNLVLLQNKNYVIA